jgi:NADH:ubiquinone oxidoreductase subunit 5 (subunit L)/multisubunit Na+/H+ antiporter MnhA subunit
MNTNNLIPLLPLLPLMALLVGFLFHNTREKEIYRANLIGIGFNLLLITFLFIQWLMQGRAPLSHDGFKLYQTSLDAIGMSFFIDGVGFVFLFSATILTLLIVVFSKTYLHREPGYKRFFNNFKAFYAGLITIVIAANFETLFIGWEILGITSFFLIGFYRDRYIPVKNALKVVSLYRIADIALLLVMWEAHHLFHGSVRFEELASLITEISANHQTKNGLILISILVILAAVVKSAQFPFSSWLPRAMEGPTSSSAIFYGSLSVHIGLLLLIRSSPIWEGIPSVKYIIMGIGLVTALVATLIARIQPSIKTQIAYSTIAQIGLMFVEISFGWYQLALFHFVGNAFLRSYQLLVSPSVLSYKIHDQFFNFIPPQPQHKEGFFNRLKLSLYLLGIHEFYLDENQYKWLWNPLKKMGKSLNFITAKTMIGGGLVLFTLGLVGVYTQSSLSVDLHFALPYIFAFLALVVLLVILNQLFITLSIGYNEYFDYSQVHLYLSGILLSFLIGLSVFRNLKKAGLATDLSNYQGNVFVKPSQAFVFALACLGMIGFPITPTFLGEELILGHIHSGQYLLMILIMGSLLIVGLVIFRTYSRLFLGIHMKGMHIRSYRSA